MAKNIVAKKVSSTTVDGVASPMAKPVSLTELKAKWPDHFALPTPEDVVGFAKDPDKRLLVRTYVGICLRKAHSGVGSEDKGMRACDALIKVTTDGTPSIATAHYAVAKEIVDAVQQRQLKDSSDMLQWVEFFNKCEEALVNALVTVPATYAAAKKLQRETAKEAAAMEAAVEKAAAKEAAAKEAAAKEAVAPATDRVTAVTGQFSAFTRAELEAVQAALSAALQAVPPM